MIFIEFFLFGSSFSNFKKVGTLERESDYYDLYAKSFRPIFVTYEKDDKLIISNFELLIIDISKKSFFYKRLFTFYYLFFYYFKNKSLLADVCFVRSKQIYGSLYSLIFARILRKKAVLRVGYSYSISKSYENIFFKYLFFFFFQFEKYYISKFDLIIFPSNYLKNKYNLKNISCTLHNPINDEVFLPKLTKTKEFDFIFVGRLIKVKGVGRLLAFIKQFNSGIIIGSGEAAKLVSSNIIFLSNIQNSALVEYYQKSKYIINFSLTEGSPKALLEGIFCGCYPILSDIPVHQEIIEELGYGLLISDYNLNLSDLLKHNECDVDIVKLQIFRSRNSMKYAINEEVNFIKNNL